MKSHANSWDAICVHKRVFSMGCFHQPQITLNHLNSELDWQAEMFQAVLTET